MINQISSPEKVVSGTSISRHVSAFAPIIFQFQRKDFVTTNYSDSSGNIQIDIATTDASLFTEGDEVYFYGVDALGEVVEGSAVVLSATVTSFTQIVIDLNYVALTLTSQYIILSSVYNEYAADFEVFSVRTDEKIPGAAQSIKPKSNGLIEFDVSPFVRALDLVNNFDYLSPANILEIAQPFYLMIGETFGGSSTSKSRLDSNDYFACMYYPPVGGQYGANMGDLLAFPGGDSEEVGEFLTDFETPTFFEGWPFSLEFIYYPEGSIDALQLTTLQQDINSTNLSETDAAIVVDDLSEPVQVPIVETILSNTYQIKATIGGITAFSFRTAFNPATDGTFDPSISTSSGVATWLFENFSTLSGNGISTSGNGLDGTNQLVKISNLDPSVITAFDAQNDRITGVFSAVELVNCTIIRLQNNQITAFFGPKSTNAAVNELTFDENAGLTDLFLSGYNNLQGVLSATDCNIGYIDWPSSPHPISLYLSDNNLPYMNFRTAFPNMGAANDIEVDLSDNGFNQSEVNSYILDFDRVFPASYTGRVIRLDGSSNSAPNLANPAVAAAKASLISKGVTIYHS